MTRRARLLLVAAPVLAASAFLGGFTLFMLSLEQTERDPPLPADGMVALTGGSQRIQDALELLGKGFAKRLLITGVNERTTRKEIKRLSGPQRDLVECCVDLDYRARNTIGNAAEIRRWAHDKGFRSLIVVTSNYHLPRALAELDEALPDIRKTPYAVVPAGRPGDGWAAAAAKSRVLLSEYAKFVAVWVRTRIASRPAELRDPVGTGGLIVLAERTRTR